MVINGPIAAGKSTVAQALGRQLRQYGHPTAVVDLDELYSMMSAKPLGRSQIWHRARLAAAALTDCFLSSGIEIVVVEGLVSILSGLPTSSWILTSTPPSSSWRRS